MGRTGNKDALFFEPWIGADYARMQQQGRDGVLQPDGWAYPFHVLGISHYGERDEYEPGLTCRIIAECGFSNHHEKCSAFFSKVLTIVGADEHPELGRVDHWRKLAFSNYIQDLIPDARIPPAEPQWERGRASFPEQLKATTPEVLLVLGQQLWPKLPRDEDFGFPVGEFRSMDGEVTIKEAWAYVYQVKGVKHLTLAVYVIHPSAGGGRFKSEIAAKRARTAALYYSNVHSSPEFAACAGRVLD